jgi:hypothetical protein
LVKSAQKTLKQRGKEKILGFVLIFVFNWYFFDTFFSVFFEAGEFRAGRFWAVAIAALGPDGF